MAHFTDSGPTAFADVGARASALAGEPVRVVATANGGGNSRVFRVEGAKTAFAAKAYPRHDGDSRDRLATEFAALTYLHKNGIECVPRPIAADRKADIALYEWIEGEPVSEPETGDIDLAADLIKRIIVLGRGPYQAEFGLASAACLSGAALVRQIDARFARLLDVAADDGALERFLRLEYEPAVGLAVRRAETAIDREGGDFTQVLDPPFRTLSPSDFGFHNALRKRDGGLVFVDFEYFGWDDPAKMVADFLWHPGMDLPTELRARFYDATRSIIAGHGDSRFEHRVRALYPLFGLCWCLILLNELLPEGWARRSSGRSANHAEAKARQLRRAQNLLHTVSTYRDDRPLYN